MHRTSFICALLAMFVVATISQDPEGNGDNEAPPPGEACTPYTCEEGCQCVDDTGAAICECGECESCPEGCGCSLDQFGQPICDCSTACPEGSCPEDCFECTLDEDRQPICSICGNGPAPISKSPSESGSGLVLDWNSPSVVFMTSLLVFLLAANLVMMCYVNVCGGKQGRARYQKVKIVDSDSDVAEAVPMNI